MNAAYEELIHLLDKREVSYNANDERQSICTDLRGDIGVYRVVAHVDADGDLFQVLGHSPLLVPEGSRPAVAEAVARANYGLRVGKFEIDLDDGELRFQASQILTDETVGEAVIDRLISTTMSMLDMYLPAFLSVIYGNELPKDAIRCVEAAGCGRRESEGDEQETGS
ncbi:MAG: YbjN domain-containing protein [Rhodopirellula sp.]|nr:YbjN domain-containing protein [Rhodopirellula sp.]